MRLLITGAGGLLGLNLALGYLRQHTVFGVDRGTLRNTPFEMLRLDLTEAGAIEQALSSSGADAVIHCAALADVDACESNPDMAWRVNTLLPQLIARACHRSGVQMIHISTDAVFDGTATVPYSESDPPNPTSVYGRTKFAAETEVLESHPRAIVARVNFYGWSPTGKRSLAEHFVNHLSAGSRTWGFTDVVFCPMFVSDLGAVLVRMLESELSGLYHTVGPDAMSKYEFGMAIARMFDFATTLIEPDSVDNAGLAATRAHNLALSVHKLSTALGEAPPDFSTGLRQFHRQFAEGYPQVIRRFQQPSPGSDSASGRELAVGAPPE